MDSFMAGSIRSYMTGDVRWSSVDRLRWLQELEVFVAELVKAEVGEARAAGKSWRQIGEALGVSQQAAHKRFAASR
jgi:hypothetical protein